MNWYEIAICAIWAFGGGIVGHIAARGFITYRIKRNKEKFHKFMKERDDKAKS